jgi:S-adenosylmethionine decarboxylase
MKAAMYNYHKWINETNPKILLNEQIELLQQAGFDIIAMTDHHFKPYGWTAIFLLGESHLAIHTFPEHEKTYIELTSCVKGPFDKYVENSPK